jgi:N-acetylglucosaminyldiphosphoundecaprenol N-acetyl-beta-D-mannosaminyltransferase
MMPEFHVLGTPLLSTDYSSLGQQCLKWARTGRCIAMDFSNTQIVTMRRHERLFREITDAYDCFAPDGMPLIWCLNRAGANLRDRVYGPTFMRKFLESVPGEFTHYLLGGSEECAARLHQRFAEINPAIRFIGGYHGKCSATGKLENAQAVIDELNALSPDFIWLAFGAPKQQACVKRYKHLIKRGVMMTVGYAFDVNAGMKPDAPAWMQRFGLTWIFRMWSEPQRLAFRYMKYNTLFLWYLILDGLRGRAWGRTD